MQFFLTSIPLTTALSMARQPGELAQVNAGEVIPKGVDVILKDNSASSSHSYALRSGSGAEYQVRNIPLSEADKQAILLAHNDERRRHNVTPLIWDDAIMEKAAEFGTKCCGVPSSGCPGGTHSSNEYRTYASIICPNDKCAHGENWSMRTYYPQWTPELPEIAAALVEGWVEENKDYNCPTSTSNGGVIGHWTQVVWEDTFTVGCAITRGCEHMEARWEMYCQYGIPGNWYGQRAFPQEKCTGLGTMKDNPFLNQSHVPVPPSSVVIGEGIKVNKLPNGFPSSNATPECFGYKGPSCGCPGDASYETCETSETSETSAVPEVIGKSVPLGKEEGPHKLHAGASNTLRTTFFFGFVCWLSLS